MLEDLKIRADFINKLRMFYETLNILEHRPEVPGDVFRDAKLLGFINKVAANLYRDPALNLLGVAEKVKALINAHVSRPRRRPEDSAHDDHRRRVREGACRRRAAAAPAPRRCSTRPATTSSASPTRTRPTPAR